jgi:hypothetical protein
MFRGRRISATPQQMTRTPTTKSISHHPRASALLRPHLLLLSAQLPSESSRRPKLHSKSRSRTLYFYLSLHANNCTFHSNKKTNTGTIPRWARDRSEIDVQRLLTREYTPQRAGRPRSQPQQQFPSCAGELHVGDAYHAAGAASYCTAPVVAPTLPRQQRAASARPRKQARSLAPALMRPRSQLFSSPQRKASSIK